MDDERRAKWDAAITKKDQGEEVSLEENDDLLRPKNNKLGKPGMFEGLNKVDRKEEAMYVVRYWLHGFDLSPISPRGSAEAENWFAMRNRWGEERQAEKLRAMIEASTQAPDYWKALHLISIRLHAEGELFPDDLADWAIEIHRQNIEEKLNRPSKPQSNKGEPHYAYDVRNYMFADVFNLLEFLGLNSKMERYDAIAEERGISERTVCKAIKKGLRMDGKLPRPWECWPPRT